MIDEKAFREIYQAYHSKLYYFSLKFTKSTYCSEEIVQEVFIKIWENRKRIKPGLSFQSYIFTATRNAIINFLKKAAYDEKMKQEIHYISDIQGIFSQEETATEYEVILRQAIDQLPPRRQKIYRMAKLEGASYEKIAFDLCIAKNTVRLQIIEANKFVKNFIRKHEEHAFAATFIVGFFLDA